MPSSVFEVGEKTEGALRPKRLNIRVDSSSKIGSGHVARIVPLAIEAYKRGLSVRIIARELSVESQTLLLSWGIAWLILPPLTSKNLPTEGKSQFPTSRDMVVDAIQTAQLADKEFFELLVSDHYEISDAWFLEVQKSYDVCAAMDDAIRSN